MDYALRTAIDRFSTQLDSTEAWLDDHVDVTVLPPKARELVESLRAYVRHCRHRIARGNITVSDVERWRRKIEGSSIAVWRATRLRR